MAIPPGNIRGIKISQCFGFNNNVFEDFVYRMANMDIAIGIGRAIMQDKRLFARLGLPDFVVQAILCPGF